MLPELAPQFIDEALVIAPAPVRSQVNKIAEETTNSIYADQGCYLHAMSQRRAQVAVMVARTTRGTRCGSGWPPWSPPEPVQ